MKKIYIPKGTIEKHENISADILVVKGHLIVKGTIRVKHIYGNGVIEAMKIIAQTIVVDIVDAEHICCKKLIANKVFCMIANVSVGIIAKDFIEGHKVKTARLTASISEIEKTETSEIVRLSPQKRSFVGAIFASWIQERFMIWRHNRITAKSKKSSDTEPLAKDAEDIEFDRVLSSYKSKCKDGGYRLVLECVPADESEASA